MHVLVIGNPVAGRARARLAIEALVKRLEEQGHRVEVFLTAGAGDARARAAALGSGFDCLVAAGGDGTLNEVINGLEDPSRVPLAQLPLGTANILARELGFPRRPEELAQMIGRGTVRRIDLGVIGARRFLSVASAGFDAAVVHDIHLHRRGKLGFRSYALPIARTAATYRFPTLAVRVDGGSPVMGSLAVVSKIRNYGGLLRITDRARCDSGRLDVCVFHRGSIPALLIYGVGALLGRLSGRKDLTYLTGKRVQIESARPIPVEVDGDFYGQTPVDITIRPAALAVLIDPKTQTSTGD